MTAQAVLNEARRLGITLEARGSTLHIEAPSGSLTPELRAALADRKADLLAVLGLPARFVALKGGLVLPLAAVQFALDLEQRGLQLRVEADDVLFVGPRDRLTADDCVRIRQWKLHLLAIANYDADAQEHLQ